MAAHAGPVHESLDKQRLGTAEVPPRERALVDGEVASRRYAGGHTAGPNWLTFPRLAERYAGAPAR